ncbi:MAG TPA: hypothetical protein DCE44_07640 [Verrucomicrobiales bacterium]|nr:hypothetical protein [Verrucomicrobiales bacterium]
MERPIRGRLNRGGLAGRHPAGQRSCVINRVLRMRGRVFRRGFHSLFMAFAELRGFSGGYGWFVSDYVRRNHA